jgi:general secretion pathway protein K
MVAAVGAIAIMAAIAASLTTMVTAQVDILDAETARARLSSAAEAGIAVALNGLTEKSGNRLWTLEGEIHQLSFDGAAVKVHIEDEHGKMLFQRMNEDNLGWLLDALGVPEPQRSIARDSYGDWVDDDEEARENGAESEYYNQRGLQAGNNWISTLDELGDIRGFTPELIDRFRKFASADTSVYFDDTHASPLAIQVMTDGEADSPEIIARRRELSGQRTAIALSEPELKDHTVSIVAEARMPGGPNVTRRAVVVVGTAGRYPYSIKYIE